MKYSLAAFATLTWAVTLVAAQAPPNGQCGGRGWTGPITCTPGYTCVVILYMSQCLDTQSISPHPTTDTSHLLTRSDAPPAPGSLRNTGVNIAGYEFGCDSHGNCAGPASPPLTSLGGGDGPGQMTHFATKGMNTFRLPIGWQYIQPTLGGTLDPTVAANYDQLVQACLKTGAYCIIDIHNYARWNGGIIGQGGPTNDQFANLWFQLATKYKASSMIMFGIMNEPHDVDINAWATTVQAAVTAIRQAGATSQMILLPGNAWASAYTFVTDGSAAALSTVKNLDGSTTNLIFDVHKYQDEDGSGTHAECVIDNVSTFQPLATWLRENKRQAILTETGGGNVQSCVQNMCIQNRLIKANSDVFLGWTGWAAGSFASSSTLSEVPNGSEDALLVASCMYQDVL